jgi:retron-type reverse transcriptase
MKRAGNLYPNIIAFANLHAAAQKAFRGHKDKPSVLRFWFNLENELFKLQDELNSNTYAPHPYQIFFVREPKLRQICAAPIRDRIVHHAVCNIVAPIWEKGMIFDSYACRVGKGTQAAIYRAQNFARKNKFYLQCDIKHFFATLDRPVLQEIIRRKIKDERVLDLLDLIICQDLQGSEKDKGVPIGNLTSQWFANLYLNRLDWFVKTELRVKNYLRYMDDFILFGDSKDELHGFKYELTKFVETELKLRLKENSTLAPCAEGISFLGFRVFPQVILLQNKKLKIFRRKLAEAENDCRQGRIDENKLAEKIQSMTAHLSQADTLPMRRKIFAETRRFW